MALTAIVLKLFSRQFVPPFRSTIQAFCDGLFFPSLSGENQGHGGGRGCAMRGLGSMAYLEQ